MKEKSAVFILIVVSFCFAMILGEFAFRTYHSITKDIPFFSLLPQQKQSSFPLNPFLVFGPRVDWQIPGKQQPDNAYFNSQGFRTKLPVSQKKGDEYRIVALGGSTTENVWNKEGIHWPLVLEKKLKKSHPKVRVLNAAMSAYTSAHALVRLQFDILQYNPDLVLIMHNVNDVTVNYSAAANNKLVDSSYFVKYGQKQFTNKISDEDIVISRLWHSLSSRLEKKPNNIVTVQSYSTDNGLKYFSQNLRNIAAIAQNSGSKVVFLTMPFSTSKELFEGRTKPHAGPVPKFSDFIKDIDLYNKAILNLNSKDKLHVIDMAQHLKSKKEYFVDTVHYSTEGIEEFGNVLSSHLKQYLDDLND